MFLTQESRLRITIPFGAETAEIGESAETADSAETDKNAETAETTELQNY